MSNKPAYSIEDQITLLRSRGMDIEDEVSAKHFLSNISYYRLKGYWWDMQSDYRAHRFKPSSKFSDVIERYTFDRQLRLILFDAIERIEVALRTKMIYHLSMSYTGLWYKDIQLFDGIEVTYGIETKTQHLFTIDGLEKEFQRSQEIFIKDHRRRYPNEDADSWKIMEVASLGTLSKLYKCLHHQMPEKATIANEMGLNLSTELSSWLEAITYVRNIIAHHSRLWSKSMVKRPVVSLNNPKGLWFDNQLENAQMKKPFLIISTLVYLCNEVSPGHRVKTKIKELIASNPNVPVYKLGFFNSWENEPIWK